MSREQKTRADFHIVAQLHVGDKCDGLVVGDVAKRLEEHHGQWFTRKHVTDDKFRHHVQPHGDVGDGINYTHGNQENNGNKQGNYQTPYWHLGVPSTNSSDGQPKEHQENSAKPPGWNIFVILFHETSMNIGLIFHLDLVNDIFAVEQDGVNNGGCHRCKRQAVTDSKCGGKEQS